MLWGFIGSLDMLEFKEMKSPMSSQGGGSALKFVVPESTLGVSRQFIRRKIN
jgi:hypothetical protein